MTPNEVTGNVLNRCRAMGFALAGVCRAEPSSRQRAFLDWIASGRHGEMAYMARNDEQWLDPRHLVPGARSIICVADRYAGGANEVRASNHSPSTLTGDDGRAIGRIARYARGADYHLVMKQRLHDLCDELRQRFPSELFRACVDTAPILEREHAQRAGLGAVGKHTLLIDPGKGSWLLLGEIITTLALEPSESKVDVDPCASCTRCIDACPTGAISPWSVDATRCISYLTIEHRSLIDEQFYEAMGDWVFGCDVCQEVCPHNQPTTMKRAEVVHEAYREQRSGLDLLNLLNWTEDDRRSAFARSAMKRAKLDMIRRNAVIAAGNAVRTTGRDALRVRIEQASVDSDEPALVRDTAQQVRHHQELDTTSQMAHLDQRPSDGSAGAG